MNSDTSVNETRPCYSIRRTVAQFLVLGVTAIMPMPTMAKDGVLVFHGQLVNSTCAMKPSVQNSAPVASVQVQVRPGVVMEVNTQHNACTGETVPFTTQFQALPQAGGDPRAGSVVSSYPAGVVTVTYQ